MGEWSFFPAGLTTQYSPMTPLASHSAQMRVRRREKHSHAVERDVPTDVSAVCLSVRVVDAR